MWVSRGPGLDTAGAPAHSGQINANLAASELRSSVARLYSPVIFVNQSRSLVRFCFARKAEVPLYNCRFTRT